MLGALVQILSVQVYGRYDQLIQWLAEAGVLLFSRIIHFLNEYCPSVLQCRWPAYAMHWISMQWIEEAVILFFFHWSNDINVKNTPWNISWMNIVPVCCNVDDHVLLWLAEGVVIPRVSPPRREGGHAWRSMKKIKWLLSKSTLGFVSGC